MGIESYAKISVWKASILQDLDISEQIPIDLVGLGTVHWLMVVAECDAMCSYIFIKQKKYWTDPKTIG